MKKAIKLCGLIVLTIAIISLFAGHVSAEAIIIDTEKGVPGFRTEPARDLPGNWWYVQDHPDSSADGWFDTNAYPPGQGNGSFWYTISFPDMDECKGIWETSLPHSGVYEVFVWIPSPDSFDPYLDESTPPSDYLPTKRAQYKVFHNGGVATVTIDQNVNKGGFTSLGVFEFDPTARVELSSNGVEFWRSVAFDAVKFVPIQTPIDTTAPGNNQTGKGTEDTVPQLAPLNPDFVAYKENPPETFYGYIPPPIDLSHLDQIPVVGLPTLDKLPSSFDWRDQGKVTSVKDQNPCGTCWTFGTTSVLESAVLIGESVVYDFSEQSVALCVDRSRVYLYDGPTDPCNGGGWCWTASGVFIKKGSVLETCNPYDTSALNCDGSCVCDDCPTVKKVDGYRLATNDGSQLDVIKNAVYNHGPVSMAFYHTGSGEYSVAPWGTIYDYYPCYGNVNHIVSIIGWDDDVPHPNPSHTGTGAWIVKNSWGTGWGNNGFFYLAYNSGCLKEIAYLTYKDNNPDEELLYWDEAGYVGNVGYGDNSAWMANVFTAAQQGDLTHVDFWTTSNNAQYELYVWNGFFGSELAYQTGTCQEFGYYSILLNEPISIDASQQFTVGVKMTTPGYGYPIPVECEISGDVDPPIQTDVSFIRHTDSGSWIDLADYGDNACLRARLTVIVPPKITAFSPPSPVNDTVCTWRTFNVTVNQTVNVSWSLDGTLQFTNESVTEAICTLHANVTGVHNVTAIASNANGTDRQTWVWDVTPSAPSKIIYPDFTDTDTPGSWRTWIGVMNTGDASTTLDLTIYNQDGSLAYSNPDFVTLEPKAAHFFRPGITAGIAQGSTIVSGNNLAGTCHESMNDGDGAKVYTAVTSSSSTLYYPDFTDTNTIGNWRTWMGVVNAGYTSTTVRLDVYNPDGSLAYTNANFVTLEPKASHFFRPGITAGIAQGCVVVSGANLAGTCHVNKNGGEGTKVYTAVTGESAAMATEALDVAYNSAERNVNRARYAALARAPATAELTPSEPITFPARLSTNELIYDDGEANTAFAWNSGCNRYAVRFTPLSYPVDLKTARICLWPNWPDGDHEMFTVEVYDDDGPGGRPGTLLGGPVSYIASDWGWNNIDISGLGITIDSGNFYIAYHQLTDYPDCEGLCTDTDEPLYERSWAWNGSWNLRPENNYMIRCVVDTAVTGGVLYYPDFTDTDTIGNWRTWLGVMNTGDASTTLNLTIYNPDGSLAYSNANFVTLEPKATHFFRPGITAGIAQGDVVVSGNNLAGTCHVNKNGGEGTKAYTALSSGSSTLNYPDFTDTDIPGNWRTWMGVMNTGATSTTVRLDVYNADGSLAYSNANFVTLEPKAAHFFRPGVTAGIAQGDVVVSGDNLAGTCHVNKNGGVGTKVYTAVGG